MAMTHVSFAILVFLVVGGAVGVSPSYHLIVLLALSSLLPDIDQPNSLLGASLRPISTWLNSTYGHRTITHSLNFLLLASGFGFVIGFLAGFEVSFVIMLGVMSHLIADGMTVSGVPLAYPDTRPFYFLPEGLLMRTGSTQEMLAFFCFSSVSGFFFFNPSLGFRSIFHTLLPSFTGAFAEYCDHCGGTV